jgi:hypothetical protein
LVPAYLKSFPVAGVAMVPLSDTKATWDFLVVWQRGRTAKSLSALLDALAVSANYFGPCVDPKARIVDLGWILPGLADRPNQPNCRPDLATLG